MRKRVPLWTQAQSEMISSPGRIGAVRGNSSLRARFPMHDRMAVKTGNVSLWLTLLLGSHLAQVRHPAVAKSRGHAKACPPLDAVSIRNDFFTRQNRRGSRQF